MYYSAAGSRGCAQKCRLQSMPHNAGRYKSAEYIYILYKISHITRAFDANYMKLFVCMRTEVNPKRVIHIDGQTWNIQFEVSPRRTTQRLATKVMKIFLTEVLGYSGVNIVVKEDSFDATVVFGRLSETVTYNGNKM